jgi:hypothetical protein
VTSLTDTNPSSLRFVSSGGFEVSQYDISDSNRRGVEAYVPDGEAVLGAILADAFATRSFDQVTEWLDEREIDHEVDVSYFD